MAREVANGVEKGEEVKTSTWHVLPSYEITHVTNDIHVFNDSEHVAHAELTPGGELHVKPIPFGRIVIGYTDLDDE